MSTTLYYGTDIRFMAMKDKHREAYDSLCRFVVDELHPKFSSFFRQKDLLIEQFGKEKATTYNKLIDDLSDALLDARIIDHISNTSNIRISNYRLLACGQALDYFAGGKLGKTAYTFIKASEILGWDDWKENDILNKAVFVIKQIAESQPCPKVFAFTDIDESFLYDICRWDDEFCLDDKVIDKKYLIQLMDKRAVDNMMDVDTNFDKEMEDEKNRIPFLYHGTDARLVKMPKKERLAFMNNCMEVVDYLWNLFKPYYQKNEMEQFKQLLTEKGNPYLYYNLMQKLSMTSGRINGNQQYQYGDLYLTSRSFSAKNYALGAFAGGEIGFTAYRMIESAEIIGFKELHADESINEKINSIKEMAKDNPQPIVIKVRNLDPRFLQHDDGKAINWQSHTPQLYRYTQDISLNLDDAEYLTVPHNN